MRKEFSLIYSLKKVVFKCILPQKEIEFPRLIKCLCLCLCLCLLNLTSDSFFVLRKGFGNDAMMNSCIFKIFKILNIKILLGELEIRRFKHI